MAAKILNEDGPNMFGEGVDKDLIIEVVGRPIIKSGEGNTTYLGYEIALQQNSQKKMGCAIFRRVIEDDGGKIKDIPTALLSIFRECAIAIKEEIKQRYNGDLLVAEPTLDYLSEQVAISLSDSN